MRVVLTALLQSLGAMANVVAMLLLVWLMFAILGVSLFKGAMQDCADPANFPPNTPLAGVLAADGVSWAIEPCKVVVNSVSNFDDVLEVRRCVRDRPRFTLTLARCVHLDVRAFMCLRARVDRACCFCSSRRRERGGRMSCSEPWTSRKLTGRRSATTTSTPGCTYCPAPLPLHAAWRPGGGRVFASSRASRVSHPRHLLLAAASSSRSCASAPFSSSTSSSVSSSTSSCASTAD